jgi:hypothetical protein
MQKILEKVKILNDKQKDLSTLDKKLNPKEYNEFRDECLKLAEELMDEALIGKQQAFTDNENIKKLIHNEIYDKTTDTLDEKKMNIFLDLKNSPLEQIISAIDKDTIDKNKQP